MVILKNTRYSFKIIFLPEILENIEGMIFLSRISSKFQIYYSFILILVLRGISSKIS